MSDDDGTRELAQASRKHKRQILFAIGGLVAFAALAFVFYRLYSVPREHKKKLKMLTETAWSWYSQLALCLGGVGTPPTRPTEIYDRTLASFEDDPEFVVRAKECGHAEDIAQGLRRLAAAKPSAAARVEIEPLITDTEKLHQAVIQIVGLALEGPVKGEDTGALYRQLWKVASGFEKLYGLVGMKSPLEPVATPESPGPARDTERGLPVPPEAVTVDLPTLGDPAKLRPAKLASHSGVLALSWQDDPDNAALVWSSGGATAEAIDLRSHGRPGPYLISESKGLPALDVSLASTKATVVKRFLGAPEPALTVGAGGRTPVGMLRVGARLVVALRTPAGALSVSSGGKELALSANAELLAMGAQVDDQRLFLITREPAGGKHKVKLRISDDAGQSFGGALTTSMEEVLPEVPTPACVAGTHLWFGANETAFHSDDGGKNFKKLVVYQPKGGGNLSQFACTPDGGMAALFLPRNANRRGLWVAGCNAGCRAFSEPVPITTRVAEQASMALTGKGVVVVWSEARRVRVRRAASLTNLTLWDPSRPLAGPEDFPTAKDALVGLSAHADDPVLLAGWFGKDHNLRLIGSNDGGLTWGPPPAHE